VTGRGTIGLAITFAVLATYLALTRPPAAPPEEALAATLLSTPIDSISRVDIGSDLTAVRRGSEWSVPQVEDLLAALATLRPVGIVDEAPSDPSAYGLGADAPRLRVLSGTRTVLDLELGAPNPAGTGLYVRHAGQTPVLLVGSLLRWEVEKVRRVASTTATP